MNGREYTHKQEKLSVIAGTWANGGWLGVNAVVVATKTDEMELDSVYITVVPQFFRDNEGSWGKSASFLGGIRSNFNSSV